MPEPTKYLVLAIAKAAISAIPAVGGPIASLIGDYIPTATHCSIEIALDALRNRLNDLEGRIDPDAVNKVEFSELFKSCYYIIVRTHQESKLRGAACLIGNILLKNSDPEKLSYTELDHFVRCLDSISVGAMEVFGQALVIARSNNRQYWMGNVLFNFSELHHRLPSMASDLIMGLLGELNVFHLVHMHGSPSVRMKDYGNYQIEFPPLGVKFAEHVLQLNKSKESRIESGR